MIMHLSDFILLLNALWFGGGASSANSSALRVRPRGLRRMASRKRKAWA